MPNRSAGPPQLRVRCRRGELLVDGRHPASGVRRVHHVVVHDRGRLQEFEGGGGGHDARIAGVATGATPAPVAERGSQALAARDEVDDDLELDVELLVDRPELHSTVAKEPLQGVINLVPQPGEVETGGLGVPHARQPRPVDTCAPVAWAHGSRTPVDEARRRHDDP